MDLRFAFAVNNENQFDDCFFGEANKFLIYQVVSGKLELIDEIVNDYISESNVNDNNRVGALIKHLIGNDIKAIVSKEFSKNLKFVNQYFIPIIISKESPEEVVKIINGHMHWIKDELNNLQSGYKLFTIKSGILKSKVEDN